MAVYTIVEINELQALLKKYDIGKLISCKGIAEGVENSNYFIETDQNKFVLTLYENRTNEDELPFFFNLLDHLHNEGIAVPKFIAAKDGSILQRLAGKPACIIEFLSGVSITSPTEKAARSTGAILAKMHLALQDYKEIRTNTMGLDVWQKMVNECSVDDINAIDGYLYQLINDELDYLHKNWPRSLPKSVIHADLFPDNVLLMDEEVSGLIDFYFAATDIVDYDIAVTHAAWCFSSDGSKFYPNISDAFLRSYHQIKPINAISREYLPVLFRGASLRFIISRTVDWINTPAEALVTKKDPIAFARRLEYYTNDNNINHILNFDS